ncbi:hypothetical protein GJ496_011475 [Pomphorhynchus laevis]|nr:hypothetical protein GJ496_011475 [Pomphorhynchus laevis]
MITTNYKAMTKSSTLKHQIENKPVMAGLYKKYKDVRSKLMPIKSKQTESLPKLESRRRCRNCGYLHLTNNHCNTKDMSCYFCELNGHFNRCCRKKPENRLIVKRVKDELSDITNSDCKVSALYSVERLKMAEISVALNHFAVIMQFDTETAVTVIPIKIWKYIGSPRSNQPTIYNRLAGSI